jgi:hypothetical protein
MGNNQVVGEYVSEEERNKIVERELRKKLTKQMKKLQDLDTNFRCIDWIKSRYKNGGYGVCLPGYYNNRNLTHIYLVRALYHWYSNIKI